MEKNRIQYILKGENKWFLSTNATIGFLSYIFRIAMITITFMIAHYAENVRSSNQNIRIHVSCIEKNWQERKTKSGAK